jgi:hypothetical protein
MIILLKDLFDIYGIWGLGIFYNHYFFIISKNCLNTQAMLLIPFVSIHYIVFRLLLRTDFYDFIIKFPRKSIYKVAFSIAIHPHQTIG